MSDPGQSFEQEVPARPSSECGREELTYIKGLYGRLPTDNRLRQSASAALAGQSLSRSEITFLIRCLRHPVASPWWSQDIWAWLIGTAQAASEHTEREVASWVLGQMQIPPDLKAEVASALAATLDNKRRVDRLLARRNIGRATVRALALGSGAALLLTIICAPFTLGSPIAGLWILAIGFLVGNSITLPTVLGAEIPQYRRNLHLLWARAAEALGRLGGPKAVSALARAARIGPVVNDPQVYFAVRKALLAVLPSLTTEHYGQLEADTVPNLCWILSYFSQSEERLQTAILEALEKVGDERANVILRQVVQESALLGIRKLAARVLLHLEARQRQEQDSKILLRASQAIPDSGGKTLLRPASDTSEREPAEQLLRPGQAEE